VTASPLPDKVNSSACRYSFQIHFDDLLEQSPAIILDMIQTASIHALV